MAKTKDLSAQSDPNPINPGGPESLPRANTWHGLPGIKRPDSPVDAAPGEPKKAIVESPAVHRPPKSPEDYCGPYLQFVGTRDGSWFGSALLLRHKHLALPVFTMKTEDGAKVQEPRWETLYEDMFGMTCWRLHLEVETLSGIGETTVSWLCTWPHEEKEDFTEKGRFVVPHQDGVWRGGFFSCNGFDATVPTNLAQSLTYTQVWNHLGSVHLEKPMHLLIWGGDQNYIDNIFDDIPFLKRWVEMDWNTKWQHEFSQKTEEEVCRYHMYMALENWERPEVKLALANIPSLMSWDDHDIFDGAGSYPPLLHDSPVMMGLFICAQRYRLLFQHHTTPELARSHQLFGYKGHNQIIQCGPKLSVLLTDGRTERTPETIQDDRTWKETFDRLDAQIPQTTQHLLAVFAVPLSFVRIRFAESVFERLKNAPHIVRQLPLVKSTNSIFGLPELYDDLLDEWTHENHIKERNSAIANFQKFAEKRQCRVTFLSGDVHCCGLSRFRTKPSHKNDESLTPVADPRLMYQIISSAIVNMPPPRNALRAYHYFKMKWHFDGTEEELLNYFERRPEGGRKLRHQKLLPNRNWCHFSLVGPTPPEPSPGGMAGLRLNQAEPVVPRTLINGVANGELPANVAGVDGSHQVRSSANGPDFWRHHWPFTKHHPYPSSLGPTSDESGLGGGEPRIHKHSGGRFCRHGKHGGIERHEDFGRGLEGDLRIRLWVESSLKTDKGRKFASYEVVVPPVLQVGHATK
ncbi:hypothetical protein BCR37DRAFT_391981 [Protomyces lactucae-debilis]|uniref:PhoD-like phosphatase domain-containing protein n=1 Tax=Protomyces lactucae-debilis TaxID=2754530 RepID=A0A1Y2FKB9_PROLT|nr:uncharacterized protein BCR37DRAFT_391981 [Protomyces lactucae-debilis]ORY84400.1 hypothetical protein BCR37DRAFT_391981 [Protomyces lactucae-debilis]